MFNRAIAGLAFVRLFQACVLLLCLTHRASSQVAVDHWTTDNGLPLNSVTAICQTPEGYLWLATFDGLVRYDGFQFTTFNKSNTKGIQGNRFGSIFCTADGGFWAGADGSGITRYDQGRFKTYTVRNGLPSDGVWGLSGDTGDGLWVLAAGRLARWEPSGQRFVPLPQKQYSYTGALSFDGRGAFYRIDQTGLSLFADGKQSHYTLPEGWPRGVPVRAGEDLNKHLWLATSTGKLAQLVDGRWSSFLRGRTTKSTYYGKSSFTSDYRDSRGRVWQIDSVWNGQAFAQSMLLPPGTDPGRINFDFNALFEDREGNIWLGSDGGGLWRLRSQTIRVYSRQQGLPDRNVYPIYQSKDGTIWIGTWLAGLCRFRGGAFTTFNAGNGLASDTIYAIGEDRNAILWVATERGLCRMRNERFESVSLNGIVPGHIVIRAIHRDPQGVMWFGSSAGLIRYRDGQWSVLRRNDGLATEDIRVIIDGRDGSLWAGGYGGLSRLRNGRIESWTEADGLASNTIRALYEDSQGVLWIGTYDGGLTRYEKGRFVSYTVRDGLFDNGAFQILEDARGNLWMSCNRGIYRVSKRQLNDFAAGKTSTISSVAYGKADGMRNVECNGGLSPAGIKTRDGMLWFPTQDGVAVIDPEKLPADTAPPPPVIESCLIDHAAVDIGQPVRVGAGTREPGNPVYGSEFNQLAAYSIQVPTRRPGSQLGEGRHTTHRVFLACASRQIHIQSNCRAW